MKISRVSLIMTSFLLPVLLPAQVTSSVTRPTGHTPAAIVNHSAQMIGPYNTAQKLRLAIGLKPPKPDEERKFVQALYTRSSPEYRKFLTAEQWNARFSPSVADEQAVVDWATEQGLTVTKRYPNRLLVDVEAPVGQIQKAFGVAINRYQLNGDAVFSNESDPVIPDSISHVVTGVFGLNNIQILRPHSNIGKKHLTYPDYVAGPVAAQTAEIHVAGDRSKLAAALAKKKEKGLSPAIDINGFYEPTDLMGEGAYDLIALTGLGHCCNPNGNPISTTKETSIAILSFGAMKQSDILGFQKQFPYLAVNVGVVNVDGTSTTPDGEGTLDVEWAMAMGNNFGQADDTAQVILYEGASPTHMIFLDAYMRILSDDRTRIMSTSWGGAEVLVSTIDDMTTEGAVLDALAGQGWTLIAASDDRGSVADCQHELVDFPASSPNVIAAGGTLLTFNTDSTFKDEVAWTGGTSAGSCQQNDGGGGGGFSAVFGAPFYQAYLEKGTRVLPDLSLNASFPQTAFIDGNIVGVSGTSIVAPELAGFFAQENAYLLYLQSQIGNACFGSHACAPIGNANYPIYIEQQLAPYAPHYPFYDITQGCAYNDVTFNNPSFTYFCASPGYDMATGLGSFNMLQLAWAINYDAAGDFGPPAVAFSGAAINHWYNQDQSVNMLFTDTTQTVRPATGVAGFSAGWDKDPAPESFSKATPGFGDAFYQGPQIKSTTGSLKLSAAGQGCHTAMTKAWDNTGTSSGLLTYGPVCYDTVAPVTTETLSGTGTAGVFTPPVKMTLSATDKDSGVATINYSLDGTTFLVYSAPVTFSAPGAYTVRYRSVDKAGNTEATRSVAFTIKPPTTKATIASSLNPSTYGVSVTFTAQIAPPTGTSSSGTVTFKDGSAVLGAAPVNGGQAVFTTKALHAGSHSVVAAYSGSAPAATSTAVAQVVNKAASTASVTSSLNPSTFGKATTLTATVVASHGGALTGTVTFKDGSTAIGTGSVNTANQATFVTSALSPGSHSITAAFGGNGDAGGSTSAALTETVNKSSVTTTLASSVNPAVFGGTVTFTAHLAPASGGPASGTVTFKDGITTIGTASVNTTTHQAIFSTAALAAGSHSITASYGGSSNDNGSASPAVPETVNKASVTMTLASSLNPSVFGKTVTFTAHLTPASGGPASGTVTFKDGTTTIGTASVNTTTHQAIFSTATLGAGSHSVTASYGGSSNDNGSTSPAVTEMVNKSSVATTLASSLNPSVFGQGVTFTAHLAPASGGPASGTVTFKDGTTTIGTASVNTTTHQAIFSTATLGAGSHSVTASYGGSSNDNGSTSPAVTEMVNKSSVATTLASSLNPSVFGQGVTFTAHLAPASGAAASGTVTFKDGATTIGTASVNTTTHQAIFFTAALAAGSHSITASYGGSGNDNGSTSPAVTETVNKSSVATTLASSLNPSVFGKTVTFTAHLGVASGAAASGTVTFKDGSTTIGTASVSTTTHQAIFSTAALAAGSHSITASYGGSSNDAGSTSAALTETVNKASTTVALTSLPAVIDLR